MEPKPTQEVAAPSEPAPVEAKPEKPKKERSEAQKAATAKALAAMTEARKARAVKQNQRKEEVKVAKKVIEKKIVDENLAFATKKEMESMKKELQELRALHEASKIVGQKPAAPERIVERVIERAPAPSGPVKLTGTALLDRLFFDK